MERPCPATSSALRARAPARTLVYINGSDGSVIGAWARCAVDPARIAVVGISQGGFWVPRAVAHEHRLAAAR